MTMQVDVFGDGDADLLWVMGFGNRADSRHERWFVDRLVGAGHRVHAAELPTNGTDFEADYLDPVRSYRADLGDHALVSHSMGGLVTAHLRPDQPVVYLSPWWGSDLPAPLRPLLWLPTTLRILPSGIDPEGLGGLATAEDVTAPSRVSPGWLSTMLEAQSALPAIGEEDVVFYSPSDPVVSVDAIREHAAEHQRRPYEGGHELFASANRERHVERVLAEL